MSKKVRKAVFPVAGMGTRFLPATKANPKEMLPVVDKPLIQYAVEEAIAAGITDLIFVTSYSKRAIEDHFDSNFELEMRLEQKGKAALLEQVRNIIPKGVSCVYIRQAEPLGLGHAVCCAKDLVGDEPFAVLLADDLIDANEPCLKQMVDVYQSTQGSVVAVQQIDPQESEKYGVIDTAGREFKNACVKIEGIVEKPSPDQAPSHYGVVGRYILSPKIFALLERGKAGAGGEIQLTDAIAGLLPEGVYARQFDGVRYDCGSKLGYLKATVNFGLKHDECASAFKQFIDQLR
ncbi:MAG: UTP--glucose-1-phosphate uridylyltransferase [Legionellaceae bacterium]|mgnify:CR=1 FL=1|nr:UTP--glucose-1-phosphate uridylyltransferase [Legionellaceae bacterium]